MKIRYIAAAAVMAVILSVSGCTSTRQAACEHKGFSPDPAKEYLVGAAAWQMSAEAHALMMQGFNIAKKNIKEAAGKADRGIDGYSWVKTENGRKLYKDGRHVAVVCDIDDTLVDGVHYTANIVGKNGEWTNKAFFDFVQSEGCTALPGALEFTELCVENGVAIVYVTNRYDQGYKTGQAGYGGETGYRKGDGTVIGSSVYDVFGKTAYDITMESMNRLGFPLNCENAENYYEGAILITNDTKLKGSGKEKVRNAVAEGIEWETGERGFESDRFPETVSFEKHHIAMLLGDDLNDISQIFSNKNENAVSRVELSIENMDKWGTEWIVFPNAVYGSAMSFAARYGIPALFEKFDYTVKENDVWEMYK